MSYIYKFLNEDNEIIYVGITKNIDTRLNKQHFNGIGHLNKICYNETKTILYSKCSNIDDAKIKERYLINKLMPKYNEKMKNEAIFNYEINDFKWEKFFVAKETKKAVKTNRSVRLIDKKNKEVSIYYNNMTTLEHKMILILQLKLKIMIFKTLRHSKLQTWQKL